MGQGMEPVENAGNLGENLRQGVAASNMSQQERQRLRQDVDSARGNYQKRDARRQDRLPPEEREKLRRDVQDANRDIRGR